MPDDRQSCGLIGTIRVTADRVEISGSTSNDSLLAWFNFCLSNRERNDRRLHRNDFAVPEVSCIEGSDAGNERAALAKPGDPVRRSRARYRENACVVGDFHAGWRLEEIRCAHGDDRLVE